MPYELREKVFSNPMCRSSQSRTYMCEDWVKNLLHWLTRTVASRAAMSCMSSLFPSSLLPRNFRRGACGAWKTSTGKIEYDRAVRWRQKRTRVSEASSPRSAQCSSANTVLDADNTKRGLSIFWFPCGTRLTGTSKHFQTPCNWRSQTAVQTGEVRIVLRVLCLSDRGMWSVSCHRPQFRDDPRIEAVRRRTVVAHRNYKRLSVVGARLP